MLLYGAQAVLTHILANIDDGNLIVAFTYDNVTLRIASVHVENNRTATYFVSAKAKATGKVYNLSIAPGIIDQSIPQTVANRLQLSVRPSGRLDGAEWSVS
jgi:hypothetical protein